jgi:hypothetical protein
MPRVFEADSIPPGPLDAYLRFYTTLAAQYPGLRPVELLFRATDEEAENQIVGFRTAVGSIVPTAPAPLGSASSSGLPEQQVDEFPWERDALVLKSPESIGPMGAILEESTASVEEQLAEAYQHVRLTLSRWLIRDARGPALRTELSTLIQSRLPLYEKRKRMDITLEPLISQWIAVERTEERKSLPILRQDCLSLGGDPASCRAAGACRWVSSTALAVSASASAAATGGRCLIHAPTRSEESSVSRIFTARLSDELLRYSGLRQDILDDHVQAIRTPRGAVRVGDELFMATKRKEGASSILSRLGFTGQTAVTFPEEMLRFEGAEEEEAPAAATAAAEVTNSLPPSWTSLGFQIPRPSPDLLDAHFLAFAAGTGRSIEDWDTIIKNRRKKLGLPGDPERSFQWTPQDFFVIAALTLSNIVFVHADPRGPLVVDRWIQPPVTGGATVTQPLFLILWGPQQLLVSKGKLYRFYGKDLPGDFLTALDSATPIPEVIARGVVDAGVSESKGGE